MQEPNINALLRLFPARDGLCDGSCLSWGRGLSQLTGLPPAQQEPDLFWC